MFLFKLLLTGALIIGSSAFASNNINNNDCKEMLTKLEQTAARNAMLVLIENPAITKKLLRGKEANLKKLNISVGSQLRKEKLRVDNDLFVLKCMID